MIGLVSLTLIDVGMSAAHPRDMRASAEASSVCPPQQSLLVSYRVAGHSTFDRVVFTFRGGVPGRRAAYANRIVSNGSGLPVRLEGSAFLSLVFTPATALDVRCRRTAAERTATPQLREIRQIKPAGDFEGYVSFGLGLRRRRNYRLYAGHHPDLVILDINH
jgi:hypothetical protein